MNTKWLFKISIIIFLFLIGYGFLSFAIWNKPGGRGDRYAGGGAYIGSNPSVSPDGSKIVFGSPRDGSSDIYLMNLDGSNWRRLTSTSEYEGDPVFSPDGSKIAFVSERDGYGNIYIINSDGTNQIRLTLTEYYDSSPSFSPDGSKIAFVRFLDKNWKSRSHKEIFIMNLDGLNQVRLTTNDIGENEPSFFPDGKKIIYYIDNYRTHEFEIWSMNVDGSDSKQLKQGGVSPTLFPDGKKIVFIYKHELYDMDANGSEVRQLTRIGTFKSSPKFNHDGSKIIFTEDGPGGRSGEIKIINADGSNLKTISKIY